MKYGLGIKLLISFLIGGIALLYKLRVPSKLIKAELSTLVKVPKNFLFDFVTSATNVPKYFSWVTDFDEIDSKKGLSLEKVYKGVVNLPFLGQHDVRYYVSDLDLDSKWVVLKPDRLRGSYLNPEIVVMVNSVSADSSQFYIKIVYHRYSALFQLFLAPWLQSMTDTQLEKVVRRVRVQATAKWRMWQIIPAKPKRPGNNATITGKKPAAKVVFKEMSSSYWTKEELEAKKNKDIKSAGIVGVEELNP